MVSERAEISDPRVRKLADKIIAAQEKEIAAIENEGEADEGEMPLGHTDGPPRIATLEEALAAPAIASLDVGGMTARGDRARRREPGVHVPFLRRAEGAGRGRCWC